MRFNCAIILLNIKLVRYMKISYLCLGLDNIRSYNFYL